MFLLYNSLRLIVQFCLVLLYGRYLEGVLSYPFLIGAFFITILLTRALVSYPLKTKSYLVLLILFPWVIRLLIILIQMVDRSFLQISFDMSFYFSLPAVYMSGLSAWLVWKHKFYKKYDVLINGLLLFLIFYPQGHYKGTLISNPALLAVFIVSFLILELLMLYLAIVMEKAMERKLLSALKELSPFLFLLVPLVFYLLLPLWRDFEEGSVAGGGGLLKSSMFRFDFSEYVQLETEISMSDDLVLMYRKEGPAERLLLRRFVLSQYINGQGFFRGEKDLLDPPDTVPPRFTEFMTEDYKNREEIQQELFLVNIDPSAFLSLNEAFNVQPIYNWDESSFVRIYKSEAMVRTKPIREIDPLIDMSDEDFQHYTFTDDDENIRNLALEITEGIPGNYLKVIAIEEFLMDNYFYSLKPGVAPDGDQLSWFIEKSKKGYCSYFAFAMALMCRSIGVPARVAVGFWVDPQVSVLNFYPVRADQAHAWVEVYFSDYGWIEFDPTSSTMYPGEQYPFAGFTIDEFSSYIEEILDNELMPENLALSDSDISSSEERENLSSMITSLWKQYWYILLLSLWGVFIFIFHWQYRILYFLNRNERKKAKCLYKESRRLLSFERKYYRESLAAYGTRIESLYGIPFVELTELYQKSRFSPHFMEQDLFSLKEEVKGTAQAYRENISIQRRILHLLFPFVRRLHI